MNASKIWYYFSLVIILPLMVSNAHAQQIDEVTYQHKMRLMDSLSLYHMKDYDTLYHITIINTDYNTDFKIDYYGWMKKRNPETILFIGTNGEESEIEKKQIVEQNDMPVCDTTIKGFIGREEKAFPMGDFGKNYLLNLWLYKKGAFDYSKQLLPKNDRFFSDNQLRDGFGIVYYDGMLGAFSYERNYANAIVFGEHLSNSIFNGYQYQKEAIALTQQLKSNTEDFKTFHIPDSVQWATLRQKLSRNEQVLYLADRLRLLNCIQPGQPAGISYDMYQFSISYATSVKLHMSYWNYNAKYTVINPCVELLKMKLNPHEVELLLPYLLSDNYIPSYTFHRDFFPERTLHKLSWVVNDVIFEITNQRFFEQRSFDILNPNEKKAEIEKVKAWCEQNAGLSQEDLTIKILKTTDKWVDFNKAMETAKQAKYESLLPILVERFHDFKGGFWPSNKGVMAEAMFDLGNGKYIGTVKKWSADTTDIWVNLWASLFLLKYDKDSYNPAMKELESVLRQCDGTAYYPHAMDLLLSMHDDKRALKLAEGILNKQQFQSDIYWDYYLNFVKKLLLLKSDYTYNFISNKLEGTTPEEMAMVNQNTDNANVLMQNDIYVLAVDKLKSNTPGYNAASDIKTRLEYRKTLKKWFDNQYGLLKEGKPNELLLNIVPVNPPVTFVDAAN